MYILVEIHIHSGCGLSMAVEKIGVKLVITIITLLSLGHMQLGYVPFILISLCFNFMCGFIPEHSSSNMIWAITSRLGMCAAY